MEVYSSVFGEKAKIEVIHAGLECAVIGSKYENIDMISFGPTIRNPHSPDESMHITIDKENMGFHGSAAGIFHRKKRKRKKAARLRRMERLARKAKAGTRTEK